MGIEQFSRHRVDDGRWEAFARALSYVPAPLNDAAAFGVLREHLVGARR
jgi:glucose-6-phosphate 1-dehydrogenase